MMQNKSVFNQSSEMVMIAFATGILLILFIPIPAWLLDLLFITNFSWALTILLLTFYTDKPLSFSTFPALLLISTLFRLALNVSATRLILSNGDAGRVIDAIGQYVIHDNYVMGLVVFMILIIVQYVVVTNGAQRVAEVAARFTLDSMPGKQMSIDADLNMGIISQAEAKCRRAQIEKEANFYGAMDGASKFVKGDAIAGVLIILVDLIGGFAIGMAQKGMSISEAIHTYSLLTVGDGLITQIPALTISLATGIIVTRAATDAHLGSEVAKQVAAYPRSLLMVCFCLVGLLCLKGIPVFPVLMILTLFVMASVFATRAQKHLPNTVIESTHDESLYEKIQIHPIEIQANAALFDELLPLETAFLHRVADIRERLAYALGFVIPEVKLRVDNSLSYPFYAICIQGNTQGVNQLHMGSVLALQRSTKKIPLKGIAVIDPSVGLDATWIPLTERQAALDLDLMVREPLAVLANHLSHVVEEHLPELLTRAQTEKLLELPAVSHLRDELIPALLPFGHVQHILQNLLEEQVSIRDLTRILEVLLDHSKSTTDVAALTELVRARLAIRICKTLMSHPVNLPVLTLAPPLEKTLCSRMTNDYLALEPSLTERLISSLALQVESMLSERKKPVLLCSTLLRRHIRQLTQRVIPHLTVLSMNEIPLTIQVESFGVVT